MNKRILILGNSGFVGKKLTKFFLEKKYNLINYNEKQKIDLVNSEQTHKFLTKCSPDIIINCAAHVGSVHYGIKHPATILHDNIMMMINIYKSISKINNKIEIINLIANCSYPHDASISTEEEWFNGIPHMSALSYGSVKKMTYVFSQSYKDQFKIKSKNLILPGIYGPGDHLDVEKTHAIGGMTIRMINTIKNNENKFVIWGDGSPIREWCYIDDLLRVIDIILKIKKDLIYPINVGQKKGYSIKDTAKMISNSLKFKGEIIVNKNFSKVHNIKILNNKNFKRVIPNFKFTPITKGIKETCKYFLQNLNL